MGWMIAAAVGGVSLVAWLVMLGRVMARRPPRPARRELLRVWRDVEAMVVGLADAAELDERARKKARAAARYARWPVDLWPFGRSDDLVLALDAIRAAAEAQGAEWVEARWPGDEAGLNALRAGLGLPARWEP